MAAIFAHHAHVFPDDVNPAGSIGRLLRLMESCGIERAVCFAPFANQVAQKQLDPNAWLAKALADQPRLKGFGTVDFSRADMADQVRRIRELGLLGIKLHPNTQKFDILSPPALAVYAAAQEQKLLLSFHTGVHHYRIKHYNLLGFDEIAQQFPDLRFSLEHIGGYHFFTDALAVIFNNIPFPPKHGYRPRVLGGLVSNFSREKLPFWFLTPEKILDAIAQVGAELLIFGLDFPYNLEEDTKIGIETIRALPISEEKKAMILGGNLRRELGIN